MRKRPWVLAKATGAALRKRPWVLVKAKVSWEACASRFRIHSYPYGRFRKQSRSLSLSRAATAAFASSPGRFGKLPSSHLLSRASAVAFAKQPRLLSQAFAVAFTGISDHFRRHLRLLSQAAQLAFAFTSSPGRVRKPLSHSKSFMVAFASSPARFRFRKSTCGRFRRHFRGRFCQVAQLAFTFESIQGRFRMQLSLLSRAVQLAFAFTSEQPQPLSQAAPVAL